MHALRSGSLPTWQEATRYDVDTIVEVAERVHPDHPEDRSVFAERLALHPQGVLVLRQDEFLVGYAIGHPWRRRHPPRLDTCLGRLPDDADSYALHDLALLPGARGGGHGRRGAALLEVVARRRGFDEMSLVSVDGSRGFWSALGFAPVALDGEAERDLLGYGPAALYMVKRLLRSSG